MWECVRRTLDMNAMRVAEILLLSHESILTTGLILFSSVGLLIFSHSFDFRIGIVFLKNCS
jgi:hypothetical protein